MSAEDAEVTEEDRNYAWDAYNGGAVLPGAASYRWIKTGECGPGFTERRCEVAIAQMRANARRDAYRAGQIAGLEEAKMHIKQLTSGAIEWKSIDARIRELKGET